MNPNRVDFLIDLAYGLLIFLAIVLLVFVGTGVGVAFGIGALVSYIIHVGWKMARFDPQWMTDEVAASVEETVTENVEETVTEEVTASVEETVTEEVTESVEATLSAEIGSIIDKLEAVNERIDERPKREELADPVAGDAARNGGDGPGRRSEAGE